VPVGQSVRADTGAAPGQAPEQRPVGDAGEFQLGLKGGDRAGEVA
jgi:hypothetical protein